MNSSRVLRVSVLVVILVVSIGAKSFVVPVGVPTEQELNDAIALWLRQQAYSVTPAAFGHGVLGSKEDCRLFVEAAAGNGENLMAARLRRPPEARSFYVFRGQVFAEFPSLRAKLADLWQRANWRLGLPVGWTPSFFVWAAGPCSTETMSWSAFPVVRPKP